MRKLVLFTVTVICMFFLNPQEVMAKVLDTTPPQVSIAFDNNQAERGNCFTKPRTAVITVKEENFDEALVEGSISFLGADEQSAPPEIKWQHEGDYHYGTIVFSDDGTYEFRFFVRDLLGNGCGDIFYGNSVCPNRFIIDTGMKEPGITGIEDQGVYVDEVAFTVECFDPDLTETDITLYRKDEEGNRREVSSDFLLDESSSDQSVSMTFGNFKRLPENDGVYDLDVSMRDAAGHRKSKSVRFRINRFGSRFIYDDILQRMLTEQGRYVTELNEDLIIHEYNPSMLLTGSVSLRITKDGRPMDAVECTVSSDAQNGNADGAGWYGYHYRIASSNFKKDGLYKIEISTEDILGHISDTSSFGIFFWVDRTPPEIIRVTGLEKGTIDKNCAKVCYKAGDTVGIASVEITVDGKTKKIIDFTDPTLTSGEFEIKENTRRQHIRIVVRDLAGNVTDTDAKNYHATFAFHPNVMVPQNRALQVVGELLTCFRR